MDDMVSGAAATSRSATSLLDGLRRSTVATQWLILVIALLILGGGIGFNLTVEHARTAVREETRLLTQARVITENIEANFAPINRVMEALREQALDWSADAGGRVAVLADAMPGVRTIALFDRHGNVLGSNRSELVGKNFAHREYFKIVQQRPDSETLYVSPPFQTSLGIYGITLSRAVIGPRGDFEGIVTATLDPQYFSTLMRSVLYAEDMWTGLAHGDGVQFVMVPERDGQIGKNLAQPGSMFSRHRDSGRDISVLTGVVYATGERRIMAIRSILPAVLHQDKALVVAVGRDVEAVYAGWWRDVYLQGGLLAAVALGAALALVAFQQGQRQLAQREAAAVDALTASERFLRAVADNIPGMVGYWTSELRCRFANRAYLEWFGKTPDQMRGIRVQDLMGDDLFRKNEPFIRAALRGEPQRFQRTLTKADGSTGYTWAQYIPDVRDGVTQGFFVLVSDVTELKRTEVALAESEAKLKAIIENEPECVKVLSCDGKLLQMNRAGLDMIEADSEAQVKGHDVLRLVLPPYRDAFADLNRRVCRGESGSLEFEIAGLKGGHRWLDTHAVPLRDAEGNITGLLGVTRDITARKEIEQELERLAQTDSLTGLANRRHFTLLAEQEVSRTQRYGGPLSVLMMDLDHFKSINDGHGHRAGDAVLRRFAELMQGELRDIDVIGRVGGEEFAVVLPQTDAIHAREVAERLRRTVDGATVSVDAGTAPLRFTVSVGVASMQAGCMDLDSLLTCADHALYRAKNAGRNAVCVGDAGVSPLTAN